MNTIFLEGNVGKDIEKRKLENGSTVARFSMATEDGYYDVNKNYVSKTNWHSIILYGKKAEELDLRKGDRVFVNGKLSYRTYEDKAGVTKYLTEIESNRAGKIEYIKKGQVSQKNDDPLFGEHYGNIGEMSPKKLSNTSQNEFDDLPY